ncbi:nad dependent epimerase dehydratase [Trichoderma arundinaceum]|uniref:Nad dependent epimerase dehydratase n=1 Tax=Trichoderma arundinaceum TaxID=490622 RepID=A0A395NVB9_TRIAR|nr:nad dependent epimerase dehydratase [Trichoderma arundinaceum]
MPESLVFITGASGYIGTHLIGDVLKAGHRVRVAVRSQEKSQLIKELYPSASDKIEYVIIPDMSRPSAYQDALKGVSYIFHLAGAMVDKGSELERDFVDPAVKGTLSILDSAKKEDSIRKVVIVSSFVSLMPMDGVMRNPLHIKANTGEVFPVDLKKVFPEGLSGQFLKYQTGKIIAHQAYRDWINREKPKFTVVSVHPSQVFGPSLVQKSAGDLSGVNFLMWMTLQSDGPPMTPYLMVDIRDVSLALAGIINADIPSGTELPITGPPYTWKQYANLVKSKYPSLAIRFAPEEEPTMTMDKSITDKLLGIDWTPMESTISAFIEQQVALS